MFTKKRLLSLFLALVMVVSMIPLGLLSGNAEAANVSSIPSQSLAKLRVKFPDGKYWNHSRNGANNPDGWTDHACSHHGTGICGNCDGTCGCNNYDGAIQCMGFAAKLAHDYYGTSFRDWKTNWYPGNLDNLKAGDIIRYGTHSVWVTKVNGDYVTFADCNRTDYCKISWGTTWKKSVFTNIGIQYVAVAPDAPKIPVAPRINLDSDSYHQYDNITVSWANMLYATEYHLRIYKDNALFSERTLSGTSFTFKTFYPGTYGFEICAMNIAGSSPYSSRYTCTVKAHNCACAKFTDMPKYSSWKHEGLEFVVKNGIMNGTSSTTISPDATLSRASMVTLLYRMAGEPAVNLNNNPFNDIKPSSWYYKAVLWSNQNKILSGTSQTTFSPNKSISREHIAYALFNYAKYRKEQNTGARDSLNRFADVGKISSGKYKTAIQWAVAYGIMNGASSYLNPQKNATRAEVATMLMRYINQYGKK